VHVLVRVGFLFVLLLTYVGSPFLAFFSWPFNRHALFFRTTLDFDGVHVTPGKCLVVDLRFAFFFFEILRFVFKFILQRPFPTSSRVKFGQWVFAFSIFQFSHRSAATPQAFGLMTFSAPRRPFPLDGPTRLCPFIYIFDCVRPPTPCSPLFSFTSLSVCPVCVLHKFFWSPYRRIVWCLFTSFSEPSGFQTEPILPLLIV